MNNYLLFLLLLINVGCASLKERQYQEAYKMISRDFIDGETSQKMLGRDISGVFIYDSIYANPIKNGIIYNNIISDKVGERTKPLRKDKILTKLSKQNLNPNWDFNTSFPLVYGGIVQHQQGNINAPLTTALFSEIEENRLRIEVVPFFIHTPKYCGSIYKYYFLYHKSKIIEYKKWIDHYECW